MRPKRRGKFRGNPGRRKKDERKLAEKLIDTLSGIFTPILPAITAFVTGIVGLVVIGPIGINNRMTIGYDTLVYPGMLGSDVAQGGAALYGVNARFKTPLYAAMAGGGIGAVVSVAAAFVISFILYGDPVEESGSRE